MGTFHAELPDVGTYTYPYPSSHRYSAETSLFHTPLISIYLFQFSVFILNTDNLRRFMCLACTMVVLHPFLSFFLFLHCLLNNLNTPIRYNYKYLLCHVNVIVNVYKPAISLHFRARQSLFLNQIQVSR